MNVGFTRYTDDLLEGNVPLAISYVLSNCHIEQHRFLTDETESRTNPLNIQLLNIGPIQTLNIEEIHKTRKTVFLKILLI